MYRWASSRSARSDERRRGVIIRGWKSKSESPADTPLQRVRQRGLLGCRHAMRTAIARKDCPRRRVLRCRKGVSIRRGTSSARHPCKPKSAARCQGRRDAATLRGLAERTQGRHDALVTERKIGGAVALYALIIVASDSPASISDAVPPPVSLQVQAHRAKTNVLIYVAADFLTTSTRVVRCRNGR